MKKSYCTNFYDTEEQRFNSIQCCIRELEDKQSKLNEIVLEKEELQRQLNSAQTYIDDTIKKNKAHTCQLTENYDELCAKYQNKCTELNENKNRNDCLNANVDELNRKADTLGRKLCEQAERYECLEHEGCKLERCANEDKQSIMCLRNQVENHKKCLEKRTEELSRTLHELDQRTDELNSKQQENCNLKSKIECLRAELSRTIEKCKLEALQLKRTIDCLRTEIEMLKRTCADLERALCEEKHRRQEVTEALERSERKYELLKQALEKERAQCDEQTCRMRHEKVNADREKNESEKCLEKRKEELRKMTCKNDHMQMRANELQCNLDAVIRDNDEKFKTWSEEIERSRCENRQLKNELSCTERKIDELEDQLAVTKKKRMAEVESVHGLRIQLDTIKCKLTVPVSTCCPVPCYTVESDCLLTTKQYDECKPDCDNPTTACVKYDNCCDSLNQTNQMYEQLITKCNSIVYNCYTT